jgi:hypothetical protein
MAVHLIKMCVGINEVSELEEWQTKRTKDAKREGKEFILQHVTRNTPRRGKEVLDGGSLYWVIRRFVQARQRIIGLEPVIREDGKSACALVLEPKLVRTNLHPHRAFQGWRYLEADDAPQDISATSTTGEQSLPVELRAELKELGLL